MSGFDFRQAQVKRKTSARSEYFAFLPDSDVVLGTTLRWNFRGADAAPGMADSYNPFIV
jgi:hypothetical protein